ncbi:MAG: thiamine-phosphate kinase [Gammaproteobacteria bacterium]|nr:MAG: thiamine-phosphate kinase [Gammaproteobacteria bacterium]
MRSTEIIPLVDTGNHLRISEFDLIRHYFSDLSYGAATVITGVGDDAAIIGGDCDTNQVVTVDTLNAGVHFFADDKPEDIARKAVLVNLSDLAAMGAEPQWITLSLTLPDADQGWIKRFSQGLRSVLKDYRISLVGGDTCRGEHLSISIQASGKVPVGQAVLRSAAKPGEKIYVTGFLGDAGAGLMIRQGKIKALHPETGDYLMHRLYAPSPRISFAMSIRNMASAGIDVSDGLLADLGHILEASHVGAELDIGQLPLSKPLLAQMGLDQARNLAMTAGEDYELCFTAPAQASEKIRLLAEAQRLPVRCIGQITTGSGLVASLDGQTFCLPEQGGYRHF